MFRSVKPPPRHATKPIVDDVNETQLHDWYRERNLLPGGIATVVGADSALHETVDRILNGTGLPTCPPWTAEWCWPRPDHEADRGCGRAALLRSAQSSLSLPAFDSMGPLTTLAVESLVLVHLHGPPCLSLVPLRRTASLSLCCRFRQSDKRGRRQVSVMCVFCG